MILENDTSVEKKSPDSKIFTANPAINGAVVGVGVGVLGSLLVGALLNEKKNCNPRGRRDTPSARFLPGLTGSKCPPSPVYHQPNTGYHQPNTGYHHPNTGYQQPSPGYQQPFNGYQQPTSGYKPPVNGYTQPSAGYQQPTGVYQQPTPGYHQPSNGYTPSNNGYNRPQQLNQGYNSNQGSVNSGYRPVNSGYNPTASYQPTNFPPAPSYSSPHAGVPSPLPIGYPAQFNARSASKPTPALFQAGIKSSKQTRKSGAINFSNN